MSRVHREVFFDYCVHTEGIKRAISGKAEEHFKKILTELGYKQNKDFYHQYPFGCKYVLDFAFPALKINFEIDGKSHLEKKQKKKDSDRDFFLGINNWIVIRIKNKELKENGSWWFHFSEQLLLLAREEWEKGNLWQDNRDFIN